MLKTEDYKTYSIEEMDAKLLELEKKLFHLKNQWRMEKKISQPHLLRVLKKDKARILTFKTEKLKAANLSI